MNDNNTELLQALSNININSETAVEAVEVYSQYLFYIELLDSFSGLVVFGIIAFFGWFVLKVIRETD